MRCLLKPENFQQFDIEDPNFPRRRSSAEIKEYCKTKLVEFYYNSVIYASDDVLVSLKRFLENPSEYDFFQTALAMRKDLWKKNTRVNVKDLFLE